MDDFDSDLSSYSSSTTGGVSEFSSLRPRRAMSTSKSTTPVTIDYSPLLHQQPSLSLAGGQADALAHGQADLLAQKQNQIMRLEGLLSSQADEHIEAEARIRDEVDARESKQRKKAEARLEKYESRFKRKVEKMQAKHSDLSDRALKAEVRLLSVPLSPRRNSLIAATTQQHGAQLSRRLSECQNELALAKMRMAELTQELKSAKDLNLSTLEQQVRAGL